MGNKNNQTLLGDAKRLFDSFHSNVTWSDVKATNVLRGNKDIVRRKECIRSIYKTILNNKKVSEAVKYWITTNNSIQTTAEIKKVETGKLKNQIYYINSTLGHEWEYKGQNLIRYCLLEDNITEDDWKEIEKIQKHVNIKLSKEVFDKESLINNRNMLINIPKREYSTEVTIDEFRSFINLIKPYFIESRKAAQQELNTKYRNAAGYLNYLMTPGVRLTDEDKQRLEEIKRLLDKETKKQYKNQSDIVFNDIEQANIDENNRIEQEQLSEQEKAELELREYRRKFKEELYKSDKVELKTKSIQFDVNKLKTS